MRSDRALVGTTFDEVSKDDKQKLVLSFRAMTMCGAVEFY